MKEVIIKTFLDDQQRAISNPDDKKDGISPAINYGRHRRVFLRFKGNIKRIYHTKNKEVTFIYFLQLACLN